MNEFKLTKSKHLLIAAIVLALFLTLSYGLALIMQMNVYVAFCFAYSLSYLLAISLYQKRSSNSKSPAIHFTYLIVVAALLSLSIGEYFVFFFSTYGRLSVLLSFILAAIISVIYWMAFEMFFVCRHNNS